MLVDLHQQFDTLELGENDFQREVLDAMADNIQLVKQYRIIFNQYAQAKKELQLLYLQQQAAKATLDYHQFLFNELEEASFKENELEDLDIELKLLGNAGNVKEQLQSIYVELEESEQPIVQQIRLMANKMQALEAFYPELAEITTRLLSTQIELQDIAGEIDHLNSRVQHNPQRMQVVSDKIALGYKLLKKHNVTNTQQLLEVKNNLQLKLKEIIDIDSIITKTTETTNELFTQCEKTALVISSNRGKAIKPFVEKVNLLLKQVGMPNARLQIQSEKLPLYQFGSETIIFLFDANKTNRFMPIGKVASGGELSRLMLCIKSLVATKLQLPTLIFDEIDTGISGEAAKQVGKIMQSLSKNHQLIAITHQPQIAAKAHQHYLVYKAVQADKVVASIRLLTSEERIHFIAQMLSGEKPSAAALENAREMVESW
jgi:DNA repair protein RecN (Recombination protein N)